MDLMSQLSMRLAKTRNVMTGKAEAKKSAVRGKRMSFIAPRPGKAGAKTELGLPKVVEEVMEQKRNAEHSDSDDAEEEWD
jgi:hypothetical protein